MPHDDPEDGLGAGEGEPEREGMYVHIEVIHFVTQRTLTQHCKSL